MMMKALQFGCVVGLAMAASASAQVATNGINIIVGDAELLPGESTTIRLEGYFGGTDYALAGLATWLQSSTGAEGLSGPRVIPPMNGPGTSAGVIGDTGVRGIIAGQLNFPATGGIFADPTNPMPFWEVTYTAPTDPGAAFDVLLETRTTRYDVYVARESSLSQSRLDDFADGVATIRVVPAPAGALVLLGVLAGGRRRRAS
jgi:hypothetical protein